MAETTALATLDDDLKVRRDHAAQVTLGIMPKTVDEAITVAKAFAAGGMFPDATKAGQALTKILMGAEFGFTPASSMNAIHFVQGKLQLSSTALATLVKRHPRYAYRVLELNNTSCTLQFLEDGEVLGEETFNTEDAKRQGTPLAGKFPRNMLFARAMSNGCRFYCPDVFGGQPVYAEGEILPPSAEEPSSGDMANDLKAAVAAKIGSEAAAQVGIEAPTEEERAKAEQELKESGVIPGEILNVGEEEGQKPLI